MAREKKNAKTKSPNNQSGQTTKKKRKSSANQQQTNQNVPQQMPNYPMTGPNPYDDFPNQQHNQMHPMQMNGPPGNRITQQRLPPNMQPPNHMNGPPLMQNQQQLHYGQNMMSQPNYNAQQMSGPPGGQMALPPNMQPPNHMNGPQMQNQHIQMQNNQMYRPNGQMMSKTYPPNKPVIKNTVNPNAPPIYPCRRCLMEVHENEQRIQCDSGCNYFFHKHCTNLTDAAFKFLLDEVFVEWCCEFCEKDQNIPLVKYRN